MKTSATHFIANKRENGKGFMIILYRFRGLPKYGQTKCHCTPELLERNSICHFCVSKKVGKRPQYKGPMGWNFHLSTKDEDIIPKLQPIEKLKEITGDDYENDIWKEGNIYAG